MLLFSFPADMGSKALQGRDRVWDLETIARMLASLEKKGANRTLPYIHSTCFTELLKLGPPSVPT